jgi:hypothetical protein
MLRRSARYTLACSLVANSDADNDADDDQQEGPDVDEADDDPGQVPESGVKSIPAVLNEVK